MVNILINRKKFSGGVDFVDITFIMLTFMLWVFFANSWKNPLANTMLGITSVILTFYLISRYTGALKFLELTKPFWTIAGIISIPIWIGTFMLLPQPGGAFASEDIVPNMLEFFVSPETATNILQSWGFGLTEGLLAGILLAFFVSVGKKRAVTNKKQQINIIAVILMVAIFMSILHISIAVTLAKAGVFEVEILFGHQILAFGIMLIGAVFTPAGMIFLLAPHIVKNLLAFNAPPGVWIATFVIFIILDFMSYFFASKKEKATYKSQSSVFVG